MAPPQLEENNQLCLHYPYRHVYHHLPSFTDVYERDCSTLVASLARYMHAVQSREAPSPDESIHTTILPTLTRLCENEMTTSDLTVLLDKFPLRAYKSRIFFATQPDRSTLKSLGDICQYEQILSYHSISATSWIIFLVLPVNKCIEVYTFGTIEMNQMEAVLSYIQNIYYLLSSGTSFHFKLRLKVPLSFTQDPIWMVYLFLDYLQRNGNYLSLTMEKIEEHKLSLLHDVVLHHDQWLGKFHVKMAPQPSFPFVTTKYLDCNREQELNATLEKHGWVVIDVCGDGNCGYYVIVLGLENIGNFQYSVTSQWTRPKLMAVPMPRNPAWQYHIIKLRHDLQRHSQYLIEEVYPRGQRGHGWFFWTGAITDKEIEQLSDDFLNGDFLQADYFNESLKSQKNNIKFQMEPFWTSHVLASMLRIRVIVYTREAAWNGVQVSYEWSTTISAYTASAENGIEQHSGIQRPSDIEFKKIPTIEILYTTGYIQNGCPEHNHFRWLRRVICHEVPDQPKLAHHRLEQLLTSVHATNNESPSQQNEPTEFPSDETDLTSESPVRCRNEESLADSQQTDRIVATKRKKGKEKKKKKSSESTKRHKGTDQGEKQRPSNLRSPQEASEKGVSNVGLATQMYCNTKTGMLSVRTVDENGKFSFPKKCTRIEEYDKNLVQSAREYPGSWVGASIGDAGDGEAPEHLNTTEKTLYQQHGNRYCLTYSLASALYYCGFREQAEWMATTAKPILEIKSDKSIEKIRELMAALVPQIGSATLYGIRTNNSCRIKRTITWKDLFDEVSPYPTLVIPALPNGVATHAFCVVDDLIFDSITPFALKLCKESVKWIFNGSDTTISQALRLDTKVSPKGHKVKGKYIRKVAFHWDHPAKASPVQEKSQNTC